MWQCCGCFNYWLRQFRWYRVLPSAFASRLAWVARDGCPISRISYTKDTNWGHIPEPSVVSSQSLVQWWCFHTSIRNLCTIELRAHTRVSQLERAMWDFRCRSHRKENVLNEVSLWRTPFHTTDYVRLNNINFIARLAQTVQRNFQDKHRFHYARGG